MRKNSVPSGCVYHNGFVNFIWYDAGKIGTPHSRGYFELDLEFELNLSLSQNQFVRLLQCSVPEGDLHCQCLLSILPASVHQFYANIFVFININPFLYMNDQFALKLISHWDLSHIDQFSLAVFSFKLVFSVKFKNR